MQAEIEAEFQASMRGPWCDIQGHLAYLHRAVAIRPGAVVIELGTRTGESTRALLAGAYKSGGQVWSCDVAEAQVPDVIRNSDRWHFIKADDRGPEAREFLPQQCDVLFIDTSHDYAQTLAELFEYMPRLQPGGTALLHDTQWDFVSGCHVDLGEPRGPVAKALNDYCRETGMNWRNRAGHYGLGVIIRSLS